MNVNFSGLSINKELHEKKIPNGQTNKTQKVNNANQSRMNVDRTNKVKYYCSHLPQGALCK